MPKVPSPSRARKRLQRNRRACDVTTRKYDAISLLRVTSVKSVDSLKQLVFDLGRRVRSIEDTVSRLPTSQSHLSDHSAGFGYGGSRDFEQYYQKYPVGPIESGLNHWDTFISNEWPHQTARSS
ncbi:hypothetical protein B0H13DRAFT_1903648 [Mycena leptocephala]|nr:hypothetical protein B0H13DRAFT_1903648 [Mycena leptocephala]